MMLSHVIIDTLCFNMNREERRCRRRELYRLRRERETIEERQEKTVHVALASIPFSAHTTQNG